MGKLMKKDFGSSIIYYVIIMALISMLCLLGSYVIRMKVVGIINESAQDTVALSNLASALIDKDEYSRSGIIRVKDFNTSYSVYEDALRENMNLSSDMYPTNSSYIHSKIDVLEYSIYNVVGLDITHIRRTVSNGTVLVETIFYNGQLGRLQTPDGVIITNTTIYSKVGFTIRGFLNSAHYVCKEGCVDIVNN